MRLGRSTRVVAAVVAVLAIGGLSAAAQGATTAPATAQAVVIAPKDGTATTTPAAVAPGNPSVTVTTWSSSTDQPLVTLDSGTSTATSQSGVNAGSADLSNVSVFGGEIQLQSLTVSASTSTDAVTLDGQGLQVNGSPVDLPAAGDSTPLGDWGTLTAGFQHTGVERRTVVAALVTLSADHDGLPAGSRILLGALTLAPPPGSGDSGGTGNGGGGGNGGGTGDPGSTPPPTTTKHHHAHRHHTARRSHAKHHRGRHVKMHHVKVHHPAHLPQLGRGLRGRVIEAAAEQIGWPYVWGGESRAEGGFDCSGLVDYAYAAAGHPLPGRPTAAVLWQMGIPITVDQLRPGDLVFLGAPSGEPYHVALYAGNGMVIVASGRGRPIAIEPLDSAPWDGFARIWAPGAGHLLKRAPWLTATVQTQRVRIGLRSDIIAAARANQMPPSNSKPSRTRVEAPAPAPTPDPAAEHGTTLLALADLRLRLELGIRAALGVPTA
ncbi:MAG TPA: C40 family peptidase [Gaiellales bacterium]|nr:C40 family peptidase [Gaiellales bacterium]